MDFDKIEIANSSSSEDDIPAIVNRRKLLINKNFRRVLLRPISLGSTKFVPDPNLATEDIAHAKYFFIYCFVYTLIYFIRACYVNYMRAFIFLLLALVRVDTIWEHSWNWGAIISSLLLTIIEVHIHTYFPDKLSMALLIVLGICHILCSLYNDILNFRHFF